MSHTKKKKKGGAFKTVIIILAVLIAVAGVLGFIYLEKNYVFVQGRMYPRGEAIDMRDSDVSIADYELLHKQYPEYTFLWNVALGGNTYDCLSRNISVGNFDADEIPVFAYFPELETVDVRTADCYSNIMKLIDTYPELEVLWNVKLGENTYGSDSTDIIISPDTDPDDIVKLLSYFPQLSFIDLRQIELTDEEIADVVAAYPDAVCEYSVSVGGILQDRHATELDFSGTEVSIRELIKAAPKFDSVEQITFGDRLLEFEEVTSLRESFNNAAVQCTLKVYDVKTDSFATELDFTGKSLSSTEDAKMAAACMPYLEKIIMCDCGISNEDMDELNRSIGDVRAVWTVYIHGVSPAMDYPCRTDQEAFALSKINQSFGVMTYETLEPLKYCTDLVTLDLGHCEELTSIKFCENMTHLKYLIVGNTMLTSLEGLENCNELYYLEAFLTNISDISAIMDKTSLKHLNLCYTKVDYHQLTGMTWLTRLWIKGATISGAELEELTSALPDTWIMTWNGDNSSVCYDWRYDDSYFEMRDNLGMPYMV